MSTPTLPIIPTRPIIRYSRVKALKIIEELLRMSRWSFSTHAAFEYRYFE